MERHPVPADSETMGRFWVMPGDQRGISLVVVSPDGMQIVSAGSYATVCVYDAHTGRVPARAGGAHGSGPRGGGECGRGCRWR